jgi:tRNA A37 threonylcarbamoyladenosine synthetase subunit TsaC/SUA5/YrdC
VGNNHDQCQLVCDGGTLEAGRSGSTVVDLTEPGRFCINRAGTAQASTVRVLKEFGLEGEAVAETE